MSTDDPSIERTTARPSLPSDREHNRPAIPVPDTDVDEDAEVYRCPYCDRPFRTIRLKTLHVGEVHGDEATDEEQDVFEKAREMESDDLFFFHIRIVIALGALYSMSAIGYTVVIGLTG